MKIAIVQPSYLPWRGAFDLLDSVDLFLFYDDVQYTRRDWRNRNRIKTDRGLSWMTVPVSSEYGVSRICDAVISRDSDWSRQHSEQMSRAYSRAPFFRRYSEELFAILRGGFRTIADLDVELCRWMMRQLGISTPTRRSSELGAQGSKTERLLDLAVKMGATCYLSGPSARAYLDEDAFRRRGIRVEYKSYDYAPYPQLWGDFEGGVSAVDLLFNTGPEARRHLKSRSPDEGSPT